MALFIIRRFIILVGLILAMIVALFVLSHLIPSDPARVAVGPEATQQAVDAMRHKMGLDKPLIVQLGIYLRNTVHLDLGTSIYDGQPVLKSIVKYAPASIELSVVSMFMSVAFGLAIGIYSAAYQGTLFDGASRLIAISGRAIAPFWLAILLQLIFYGRLGWFPSGTRLNLSGIDEPKRITGMYLADSLLTANWHAFVNSAYHLVLPAFALGLGGVAEISRMTRATMLIELRREYTRTARSKGLRESTILYRHVVRNAINPVVTIIGIRFGYLLAGTVLIESIFRWPGIGRYSLLAIQNLDFPAIMGVTLFVTVTFAIVNLIIDILYGFLDPRIRYA